MNHKKIKLYKFGIQKFWTKTVDEWIIILYDIKNKLIQLK